MNFCSVSVDGFRFRSLTSNETGTQKWDTIEDPMRQVFCVYRLGRVAKRRPRPREESSGIWCGLRCHILCSVCNEWLESFCVPLIYRVEIRWILKKYDSRRNLDRNVAEEPQLLKVAICDHLTAGWSKISSFLRSV